MTKANAVDEKVFDNKIRVAILSNHTVNGLSETLRVKCADKKISCITYTSGYNQYNQDIINSESNLYKFSPDVVFLILDTRSILEDLFYSPYSLSINDRKDFIKKKTADLLNLVQKFTINSKSKLVITNFCVPTYSPYGITETKTNYGLQYMVHDLNTKLADEILNESSVYLYDFDGFVKRYGEMNVFDYRQFFFGDIRIALDFIPYLANDLIGYIVAMLGMNRKCIVLDLDNTLWGGIVGEDGFDGIKLGLTPPGNSFVEFQRRLLSLWKRGIILAINSKNNFDDAIEVIRKHPHMVLREENFASIKINWEDKLVNMKQIANELNIGLNSVVYFDDDPVNRERILRDMPEILTIGLPNDPSHYSSTLTSLNDFNILNITEEDLKRGKMYLQKKQLKDFEQTTSNLEDFLKQLDIKLKIKRADQFTIPRISQLTLKTNQFNLTTHRYQEEDIRRFCQDHKMLVGCAQVEDKFGDNGITGVFIVNKESKTEWSIDTFLLSCRIMGRGIEDGILGFILQMAKNEGVSRVKGKYIPTSKNKPCENFFSRSGFKKEDGEWWVCSLNSVITIPAHLMVTSE